MTRRMFINALYPEECRIAVADDDQLIELEVERADHAQLRGNIYKAAITRIEPSLQAAFLDIGSNRNGFLQINDIHPAYFQNWPPENSERGAHSRPAIQEVLRPGQELVVQVVKDQRAAKGATLTTNLSIPGRFLVMMVGNQRGGVSRKIVDESQRRRLKQAIQGLRIPPGMGVIVRTAGINRSTQELQDDLDSLLEMWFEILQKSLEPGSPKPLYQESDIALRTIRDYLNHTIEEILIDDRSTFDRVLNFIDKAVPSFKNRVIFFDKPQPLFSAYHLDGQVEEATRPEVILPSGGSIVINSTEAVVAIDVNSGRATSQSDVEETAFVTNKEAAETVAKQLRLRDLGGLIVIDFIDMNDKRHKQVVEKVLRDSVRHDKAKIEIGRISKFGLLEMSRQRLKSSLTSHSDTACPHCNGRGRVRTPESAALEALRKIQSAAFAGGIDEIRVRMSPVAALLLLNSKRQLLSDIERQSNTRVLIYADGRMKPDEYELELSAGSHSPAPQDSGIRHTPSSARNDRRQAVERDTRDDDDADSDDDGDPRSSHASDGRGGDNRGGGRSRRDRRSSRRGSRRNRNRQQGGGGRGPDSPPREGAGVETPGTAERTPNSGEFPAAGAAENLVQERPRAFGDAGSDQAPEAGGKSEARFPGAHDEL